MIRRSVLNAAVVTLGAIALVGCSGPGPAVSQSAGARAEPVAADYVIGPGDQLQINVYHFPDLSLTLPVRPDGRISMPLVADLPASGKTSTQLAKDIEAKLTDYVKDANVSVIVSGFVGPFDRQIRVIGEAAQPMALPYRDHMTVLDVMIEAKGLTRFAAGNRAEIARRNGNAIETIPVRLGDLMRDGDITQNVMMQPGDTLIIPQTWF